MKTKTDFFNNISPYIYGTTRLGDDSISVEKRVETAIEAINSGVWFHTSIQYNTTLNILRKAFDKQRSKLPHLIIKLEGNNIEEFRACIKKNIEPLGIESVDIGQLCLGGKLADEFANGGNCYREFEKMKEEGLVKSFVLEVFPWTSNIALKALKSGYSSEILDAHIMYLNPLQRFASNELWDLLLKEKQAIIAMRTVAGGSVHKLRDVPNFAWKKYLQERAVEVAPIFEKSGLESWTKFCIRFAHSITGVIATVGATSRIENLKEFLAAQNNIKALPSEIIDAISNLQYRWSDELDIKAEPWTM
jgi:predicted aldo/keto reductase-like oxidoreductase